MNIQTVQAGLNNFFNVAYSATVTSAQWLGKNVQFGVTNYLIPGIQSLWAAILPCFIQTKNALLAGQYPPFFIAAVLFIVGITVFKIADRKANEDDDCGTKVWRSIGGLSLMAAMVFTGFGLASPISAI